MKRAVIILKKFTNLSNPFFQNNPQSVKKKLFDFLGISCSNKTALQIFKKKCLFFFVIFLRSITTKDKKIS